ncbi:hypothetical protein NDU88_005342 [Pleurodeles waltl]|uniref:Uncharacterized protein n=1 Tax=Pleurodeles waltl TaxID=8319 RepID=A0AAV7WXM1_PLEWA|nr:hypothetical protein NDU88_005342 [Pleurodeles waltl]
MAMAVITPIDNQCTTPTVRVLTPLTTAVAINSQAEDKEGADRVGEDTGDVWMDVVEVAASEVYVLLGVVMVVVAVDAVHAGEEETGNAPVAGVGPEDSEEAEDEDVDNKTSVI